LTLRKGRRYEQLDQGPILTGPICEGMILRHLLEAMVRTLVSAMLFVAALSIAGSTQAQTDAQRSRLLILVESDSRLPLAQALLHGIEAELGQDFTTRSEIYVEYLDLLRFNDPRELELIRMFLVERYGGIGLNAIGVLGTNALGFVIDNRDALAPGAPVVFGGLGEGGLATALAGRSPANLSGVISPFDPQSTIDLALTVQPDAPEIVAIAGSANFDRQWRVAFSELIGDSYRNVPVRLLPEASADDYLAEVRSLDPRTIVLHLTVSLDAAGRRFLPIQFAEALAGASAAPVWSLYETQIGKGVVGGSVEDLSKTGAEIGKLLRTAVAGAPLPGPVKVTAGPAVDWRVMQRHGLDLDRLPQGSRILFYEPSLWERYRALLLTVAAVVAAQTATIVGLIFQRRRYFRTQAFLDLERSQLIHVSRNLRLGQLSASLAHEINQPLAAIQANAEAGTRLAVRSPPDIAEIGAIFQDINADVRRAGSTIAGLRRLMVKGEVAMERTDLNEVIRATLPLVQNELDANGSKVRLALSPEPVEVNGNAAQLQQIVLNLVLNASEAMTGPSEGARVLTVASAALPAGGATVTVEDVGPGVAPDKREEAFRPFVSTKASGLGVGLAICRSIAEAHGGTLAFADGAGPGACVVLTLPQVAS
jgi:signal transduction histidine kinase